MDMIEIGKNLKELRLMKVPDECSKCEHSEMCRGGLKCLTYAMYKDLNHKDIGCNLQEVQYVEEDPTDFIPQWIQFKLRDIR